MSGLKEVSCKIRQKYLKTARIEYGRGAFYDRFYLERESARARNIVKFLGQFLTDLTGIYMGCVYKAAKYVLDHSQ